MRPAWYSEVKAIHALGLRLKRVRRYRQQAWWLLCKTCGESVLALRCSDCGWDIGQMDLVANHVTALRDVRKGLGLFKCSRGCNAARVDDSPSRVLVAQAEEAAAQTSGRARDGARGRRTRRTAAR